MGRKERDLADFALGRPPNSRGGPFSLPLSPPKPAPEHFSARPAKDSRFETTPIFSSPSARSSPASWSATFSSSPTTTTKSIRSTNISRRVLASATKNAASAVFLFTRLLASGARLYVAAIALALAYEMIPRVDARSNRNAFHLHWIHHCHRDPDRDLHHARWNQGGYLDRRDPGLDHDRKRGGCARFTLFFDSRRLERDRPTPGRISIISDFITTGLDPAKSGWNKSKACSRSSIRFSRDSSVRLL